jgi:putative acetyltransferase
MKLVIRPIEIQDNEALAAIIRDTLIEFGAAKQGTMYYDPALFKTYEAFQQEGCAYFVVLLEDKIVGGAGIFRTKGLPKGVVELSRMYLLPEARGKGLGKKMIQLCESTALQMGYQQIYLETMKELNIAVPLYESLGYSYVCPLGESGHFACEISMLKTL